MLQRAKGCRPGTEAGAGDAGALELWGTRDRRHRIDENIRTLGGGECAYNPGLLPG